MIKHQSILLLSLLILLSLLSAAPLSAQNSDQEEEVPRPWKHVCHYPRSYVEVKPLPTLLGTVAPLVVYDLMLLRQDDAIRGMRNHYTPNFHLKYGDYTQFAPLATVWGLRLAGVEGRSESHLEALTAQAFSFAVSTAIVRGGKHITKRTRPDGSNQYSFPSGHTATAFTFATVLDAEYGDRYPWLSALGYGVAGVTGVTRVLNDRHWASDVITGAGVGVLSTYVGYLLSDLVWGRGLKRFEMPSGTLEHDYPWMVSLDKNFHNLLSGMSDYKASGLGNSVGLSVRAPLYRNWGALFTGTLFESQDKAKAEQLHLYALMAGVSYMYPFLEGRLQADAHLSLGYLSEGRLSVGSTTARSESIPFIASGVTARVGAGIQLITTPRMALRAGANYWFAPLSRPYDRSNKVGLNGAEFGLSMNYLLH